VQLGTVQLLRIWIKRYRYCEAEF